MSPLPPDLDSEGTYANCLTVSTIGVKQDIRELLAQMADVTTDRRVYSLGSEGTPTEVDGMMASM